jgi:hypothetical protein
VDDSVDFKTRIDNVLTETGFTEARPAKMTIDDLLKYVHRLTQYELRAEAASQIARCLSRHRCTLCIIIFFTFTLLNTNWELAETRGLNAAVY